VISGGNRPHDPGHGESDGYQFFDYADASQVAEAASAHDVIGIVPSCHDRAAVAASQAANAIGLPGHDLPDVTRLLHNKDLLRTALRSIDIPTPQGIACETPEAAVKWLQFFGRSALLKPPDLAGGRGIVRVENVEQLNSHFQAVQRLSRSTTLVLEEFIAGTNHGVSMLLRSEKPAFVFADDEYYGNNPYRVAGASAPTSLSDIELSRIIAYASRLAQHFGLVDGLLHLQVISGTDDLSIIEVSRRPPGDFYPRLVDLATGYDYSKNMVRGFLGLLIERDRGPGLPLPTVRHVLTADHGGVLSGFHVSNDLQPYVLEMETWAQAGTTIHDPLNWSGGVLVVRPDGTGKTIATDDLHRRAHALVQTFPTEEQRN